MGVTLKEVARQAGVSPSTVSRVIADHPRISETTKQRVREVMRKLGYVPRRRDAFVDEIEGKAIYVFLPNDAYSSLTSGAVSEVVRGLNQEMNQHQYTAILKLSTDIRLLEEECLSILAQGRTTGVLIISSQCSPGFIQTLNEEKWSVLAIGSYPQTDNWNWLDIDYDGAAESAVAYLRGQGHQSIAYLAGDVTQETYARRQVTLQDAAVRLGLSLPRELIGADSVGKLLEKGQVFSALITADEQLASRALKELKEAGKAAGKEIAVLSMEEGSLAARLIPALTSLRLPYFQLGVQAARSLLKQIEGQLPDKGGMLIPGELIVRESA